MLLACIWCDEMFRNKKIKMAKDQSKVFVIVVDNPCNKNDFPELINPDYFCKGMN